MLRTCLLPAISLALCACSTGKLTIPADALRIAKADIQLREDIETYSTYAVAKYAGLTDEPYISADKYTKLIRTVKDDPWIAEQAVYSLLRIGDVDEAVKVARSLPDTTLHQTELPRLALAVDALERNKTELALSHLNQPWFSDYHAMLARSLAAWVALDTDPDTALRLQQSAGGGDGFYTLVSQTLGAMMKVNLGLENEALSDLAILWEVKAKLAVGVETEVRLMAREGRIEEAKRRLKEYREEVGRHPSLVSLGREIDRGEVAAPRKLNAKTGTALAFYIATASQAMQDTYDIPAVYFALAVHLDPQLDGAKALWADTLDRVDRRPEAIALLESIPATSIHHTSAQGQLAWALRREGEDIAALEIARDTLESTDDRNIRVQLADLLQSLGRDGEAEAVFADIIEADKAEGYYDWRIYYARGAARERIGVWPPAENDLKTAMSLNPENPAIMNYLGYSWVDRGVNLQEGLELIEKALRLAPDNGAITDSLGWAHYKLGNYDRAIFYLERAAELAPALPEILDHLGDAYWQVGRFKEAGYQWERALAFSEDEDERDLLLKKLEGGLALLSAAAGGVRPPSP